MRKRRNFKKKQNKLKHIINFILIFFFIFFLVNTTFGIYKENKIKEKTEDRNNIIKKINQTSKENKIVETERPKEKIDEEYKGYKVEAKLEIPKINVATNVLSEYTKEALNVCVTKFWGGKPNQIGNYCIAGHNMNKENMFYNLDRLEIGDSIFLTDTEYGRFEYKIYDIYKVDPQNTKSLSQVTKGKREITLITCTNYSNHRIIVKAKEV